jgi:hypothetical protein
MRAGWETASVHHVEGEQKIDDPQVLENLVAKAERALEAALGADEGVLPSFTVGDQPP